MIPKSKAALDDALNLANEALANLELIKTSLTAVALKASRLARLLNDPDRQRIFQMEASGYPHHPDGYPPEIWKSLQVAGRITQEKDPKTGEVKTYGYWSSIEELEQTIETNKARLAAASDPDVSVSSSNPNQYVYSPFGNKLERDEIQKNLSLAVKRLSQRRAFLHAYLADTYIELKYSTLSEDVFSRLRQAVDGRISETVSPAVHKLTAVYENLTSENPEDWANAVHSCRRVLQDLADAVFPPSEPITKSINGKERTISMCNDNYINRLVAYIESKSTSNRFQAIVGSHLSFVGDRLDAVFQSAQKGSHSEIVNRTEADRYVVYTYLLVGDILSL